MVAHRCISASHESANVRKRRPDDGRPRLRAFHHFASGRQGSWQRRFNIGLQQHIYATATCPARGFQIELIRSWCICKETAESLRCQRTLATRTNMDINMSASAVLDPGLLLLPNLHSHTPIAHPKQHEAHTTSPRLTGIRLSRGTGFLHYNLPANHLRDFHHHCASSRNLRSPENLLGLVAMPN